MSDIVYLSGWLDSKFCTGPPNTMFVFSAFNGSGAPLFLTEEQDYYIPTCGLSTFNLNTGCCLSSIDSDFTLGYTSFTRNYLVDSAIEHSAPLTANNNLYCKVNSLGNSSLWGYSETYYLANSKYCLEGNIKCDLRNLYLYNDSNCNIPLESHHISNAVTTINSSVLGLVEISLTQFAGGQIPVTFTAYTPSWDLYINFSEPIDTWIFLVFLLSLVITFTTGIFYTIQSIKFRQKKYIFFAVTQYLWTIRILMDLLSYFCPTTIAPAVTYAIFIIGSWSSLASLCSAIISFQLIFEINMDIKPWYKYLTLLSVALIHFGLQGLHYISHTLIFVYLVTKNVPDQVLGYQLNLTAQTPNSVWLFLQFLIDTVPPVIILIKIYRNRTVKHANLPRKSKEYVERKLTHISIIFLVQFINMIVFGIIDFILNTTNMFNSDRMYGLGLALTYITLSINSCCVLSIFENLTRYVRKLVKKDVALSPIDADRTKVHSKTKNSKFNSAKTGINEESNKSAKSDNNLVS
ncbi:hypothetical protein HDV01_003546 [Terramyces sp. JEL0728]|nr:hypothetical protein HDV01_003546 [Terramyces sp. JEL0728]